MNVSDVDKEMIRPVQNAGALMALFVGGLWSATFLLHMYGLRLPILGLIGNLVGLVSVWTLYANLLNYKLLFGKVSLTRMITLALLICLMGCMLTGLVQYIYFALLDGGQFMQNIMTVMEQPEYDEALKEMIPVGMSKNDLQKMLQEITVGELTVQLLIMNLMMSIPMGVVFAFAAWVKKMK